MDDTGYGGDAGAGSLGGSSVGIRLGAGETEVSNNQVNELYGANGGCGGDGEGCASPSYGGSAGDAIGVKCSTGESYPEFQYDRRASCRSRRLRWQFCSVWRRLLQRSGPGWFAGRRRDSDRERIELRREHSELDSNDNP
jgi:hypothetical protein